MREKQLLDVGELVLPDQLGQRPQEEAAQRDDDDADGDEVEPVDPVRVDRGVEVRGVVAIGAVLHVASGRKGRELRNKSKEPLFFQFLSDVVLASIERDFERVSFRDLALAETDVCDDISSGFPIERLFRACSSFLRFGKDKSEASCGKRLICW